MKTLREVGHMGLACRRQRVRIRTPRCDCLHHRLHHQAAWVSRRRSSFFCRVVALIAALGGASAWADYVFGWPFVDATTLQPRRGTSQGPDVTLATETSATWRALRERGLSQRERDRRAILALAGDYRTSFDFLETVEFSAGAGPAKPYRSWGTERIYVVDDRGDAITLQHVIVMFTVHDGVVDGPFVQKHWRQDWRYEPESLSEYRGHQHWERRALSRAEREGAWAQDVYQVDDAPRYSSVGRWEHTAAASIWTGSSAWRPLPRREFTVRSDYDVLVGVNRATVLPLGWVHEQDNLKLVLGDDAKPRADAPYVARELGIDRYERIQGFDFSAGDAYWRKTGDFWRVVRNAWTETIRRNASLDIADVCNGRPAFEITFGYAERLPTEPAATTDADERIADEVLKCTVSR